MSLPPRDAVGESIENFLRARQKAGKGMLTIEERPTQATVRFGVYRAQGPTRDIALVRLAKALLDDADYRPLLRGVLRGAMPKENSST